MITKLLGRNIKAQSFDWILGPLNIITGRNRRGKTARLDAIRVGLLGYHPRLGKTNAATAKLATGQVMDINMKSEDGQVICQHTWNRNGKTWSHNGYVAVETPEVILDFRVFTGKSGPERLRYVIERTDLKELGFTHAQLLADLQGLRVEEPSAATTAEQVRLCAEVQTMTTKLAKEPMPVFLAAVVTYLKDAAKRAKAKVVEAVALIDGAARRQAESGATTTPPRSKPVIDAELAKLREQLAGVRARELSLTSAQADYNRRSNRQRELEQAILSAPDHTAAIGILEGEIATLEGKVKGHTSQSAPIAEKLMRARVEATRIRGEWEQSARKLEEVEESLRELEAAGSCPHCGSKGKGWKKTLQSQLESHRTPLIESRDSLRMKLDALEQSAEDLDEKHASAIDDDHAWESVQHELENKRTTRQRMSEDMNRMRQLRAELAGLDMSSAPATADLPALHQQVQELTQSIRTLEQEQNRAVAAATDTLRREEAKMAKAKAEAELAVAQAAAGLVAQKQEELVEKSMAHLLQVANRFTDGLLDGPLEYVDGEIGYRAGAQWVSLDTFSGTEEAVAYIGLSVALAQEAPLKIVLMDEMGVIDDENAPRVLARMSELQQAGIIHQFVGADPHIGRYPAEVLAGVKVERVQ